MPIIKTGEQSQADPFEFVMSDESVDRVGDIIEVRGWQLAEFKKNPIALYGHDSSAPPIGTWENVRVEGKRLVGRLKLAAAGTSAFIDTLRSLLEQRILRAVSVGFQPLKAEPIDRERPYAGQRFRKQTLLECSLVAVPANPAALAIAKHLDPQDRTRLFAESGEGTGRVGRAAGTAHPGGLFPANPARRKGAAMSVSERISASQQNLTTLRDRQRPLALRVNDQLDLSDDEAADFDRLNAEIADEEKTLDRLRATERALSERLVPAAPVSRQAAPSYFGAGQRSTAKAGRPMDLLVRLGVCSLVSHVKRQPIEQVLVQRYRDHEDLAAVTRAVTSPAMTDVVGWAAELVDTAIADFMETLMPVSAYAQLAPKGARFSFDRNGAIKIPRRNPGTNAPGDLRGAFVGEGQPIPVRRGSTASLTLFPYKMGVISTYSREIAAHSTPAIEAVIRQGITEDTAIALDTALLDSNALIAGVRPAGLMNGVTPTAGAAGGDVAAVIKDISALVAPFVAANAATGIVILANPSDVVRLGLLVNALGAFVFRDEINSGSLLGFSLIQSTNVPAKTLIAVRAVDFASATGDAPSFDISDTATIHEEDGGYPVNQAMPDPAVAPGPLPIATGAAGAGVVATPVRSLWQTASIGMRMLLDVSWGMRRAGMVHAVNAITW